MLSSPQSFNAGGSPFSMLDAMKGGKNKKIHLDNRKADSKIVREAWKNFNKDVKSVKDKYLKEKLRLVGGFFKNKMYGGVESDEPNENEPASVEEPAPTDESESIDDKLKVIKDTVNGLVEKVTNLEATVGISNKTSYEKAKAALEDLTEFVEAHQEEQQQQEEQNGGKKNKSKSNKKKHVKRGGELPGQYAINNIYNPENGSSVTLGGKKKSNKKRGGNNELASVDPNSYNLLKGGNSLPNSGLNPLGELNNLFGGSKKNRKSGGNLGVPGNNTSINGLTTSTPAVGGYGAMGSPVNAETPSEYPMGNNMTLGGDGRRRHRKS